MSNSIITISGVARSGKDTLASSIVSEIYQTHGIDTKVFKFADPLKRALKVALLEVGIDYIDPFTEDEETKKLLRPLMVEFGKYCRALNKDVFVNATIKEIEKVRDQAVAPFIPVISDLRYLNEIQRVRSWASNQSTTTIVYRAHINRVGTSPANAEEERSIDELNFCDYPTSEWHFQSGDMEGIKGWAKKIANQACDGVKPEPRIIAMDAPDLHALRYGVTATVPEHLTGTIKVPDNELLEQVLNIKLTLERMDARLKRLEANRLEGNGHGF